MSLVANAPPSLLNRKIMFTSASGLSTRFFFFLCIRMGGIMQTPPKAAVTLELKSELISKVSLAR